MDSALVVAALLMGLAGGPHCAAMCGAACSAVAGQGGPLSQRMLALHAGRIAGYAAGGALAATSVSTLASFARGTHACAALGHGACRGDRARPLAAAHRPRPAWLSVPSPRLARHRRAGRCGSSAHAAGLPAPGSSARAGRRCPAACCNPALLVAALASGALSGAAVMAGFALASTLGLWLRKASGPACAGPTTAAASPRCRCVAPAGCWRPLPASRSGTVSARRSAAWPDAAAGRRRV
jgi:hypothetical protein